MVVSDGSHHRGGVFGNDPDVHGVEERMSCGWVVGTSGPDEDPGLTGTETGHRALVIGRGGTSICDLDAKPSSFATEATGVLGALRMLMESLGATDPPGVVWHWCDNQGVVDVVNQTAEAPSLMRRHQACRHIFAELFARLEWWREAGGTWQLGWVKGHVDTLPDRSAESYTVAECLNMEADSLAAWAGRAVEARPPTTSGETGTRVVGGVWRRCSSQRPSWDDRTDLIYEQGRALVEKRYWQTRQERRGTGAVKEEVGWDRRVLPTLGGRKRARQAIDLFRTKLWWDHLPSPEVLHRGEANPPTRCMYCEEPDRPSSWHVLAECRHPRLVSARAAATRRVRAEVMRLGQGSPSLGLWSGGFETTTDGDWVKPLGWGEEGGRKAGVNPNPWYGCLPPAWLDHWGGSCTAPDKARHWDAGRSALGKISAEAVLGCYRVWGEATKLWSESQRLAEQRDGARQRTQMTAEELMTEEAALRGHVGYEGLGGLDKAHYQAAVTALHHLREEFLAKRRPLPEEKAIMMWQTWSLRKVLGWWRDAGGETWGKRLGAGR